MDGKTVVITGATRGIGKGFADHFRARGYKLGLCGRSMEPRTSEGEVHARVDVTDRNAVQTFAEQVNDTLGTIDLWINNAGVLEPVGPLRSVDTEGFRKNLDINVMGVLYGCQSYIQHVRQHGGPGVLINISSGAAQHGYAGWSAYCAGKAAVDRMSECIHDEEADIDLRVHAVAPGVIDTDMQELIRGCSPEEFPAVDRFIQMKKDDSFSSLEFVARTTEELAFGDHPDRSDVVIRFPPGK